MKTKFRSVMTAAGIGVLFAGSLSAQVTAYHHHSTAAGDYLGGAAELELASGIAANHRAQAWETAVQLAREFESLRYEVHTNRVRKAEARRDRVVAHRQARQERAMERRLEAAARAAEMVRAIRSGQFRWPAALLDPQTKRHAEQAAWAIKASEETDSESHRNQIATAAGAMKTALQRKSVGDSFLDRQRAARVVVLLEILAAGGSSSDSLAKSAW